MKEMERAYKGFCDFVDDFGKSTTVHRDVLPSKKKNREAWYAQWDDNSMTALLNSKVVKTALKKIADSYFGEQLDDILKDATQLTNATYPNLNSVYDTCCSTLGMYNPPKAYVTGKIRGINALSVEVRDKQLILISPQVAVRLSEKEQSFLLGHEISHHQQGNLVCHTVSGIAGRINNKNELIGSLINDAIDIPLKRWSRCSEINADRGGYLCCKDLDSVKTLLNSIGEVIRLNDYKSILELYSDHPLKESRLNMIYQYARMTSEYN